MERNRSGERHTHNARSCRLAPAVRETGMSQHLCANACEARSCRTTHCCRFF